MHLVNLTVTKSVTMTTDHNIVAGTLATAFQRTILEDADDKTCYGTFQFRFKAWQIVCYNWEYCNKYFMWISQTKRMIFDLKNSLNSHFITLYLKCS